MGATAAFCICLLASSTAALAEPPEIQANRLYGTAWGLTLANDGTGFYNELVRFVIAPINIDYEAVPYRRAMRRFYDDIGSCVYPKSISTMIRTQDIPSAAGFIESVALLKPFVAVFSRPGFETIHSAADLTGKRVAYAMGSKATQILQAPNIFFIAVADEAAKAQMLTSGRVDAMVGSLPDAGLVYRSLGETLPPYDRNFRPLPAGSARIVCHNTPGNQALMDSLNKHIRELHKSGELARFFSKYGLDAEQYLANVFD